METSDRKRSTYIRYSGKYIRYICTKTFSVYTESLGEQETILGETYYIYDPIVTTLLFLEGPLLKGGIKKYNDFMLYKPEVENNFVLVKGYGNETIQLLKNICQI